jgi:hypothetical protein
MWNISEDDVRQAIEQLKGRRDAIQARYDSEMKKVEADSADLETFERLALKLASDRQGTAVPSTGVADLSPAPKNAAAVTSDEQSNATSAGTPVEPRAEAEPAADGESAGASKGSSRWRMRLGTGEASR